MDCQYCRKRPQIYVSHLMGNGGITVCTDKECLERAFAAIQRVTSKKPIPVSVPVEKYEKE